MNKEKRIDFAHYFELGFSFFPLFQAGLVLWALWEFLRQPGWAWLATLLFSIYLLPLITFRLLQIFFPVREGRYPIGREGVEGWVLLLKVQMFLGIFPVFERCLHLVPGLYSAWLRAWGSQIGRGVLWTPQVDIIDRPLMKIGHGALIGHRALIGAHAVSLHQGKHYVYCKPVKVGAGALIGGESILGPGCVVGDHSQVNAASRIYPNQEIPSGSIYDQRG